MRVRADCRQTRKLCRLFRNIAIALIDSQIRSYTSVAMHSVSPSDGPAALVMGTVFLAFGLTMILRPSSVRANFDRFADYWKQGSWHPYKMPLWGLRLAGVSIMAVATLFFYIAYVAFRP